MLGDDDIESEYEVEKVLSRTNLLNNSFWFCGKDTHWLKHVEGRRNGLR